MNTIRYRSVSAGGTRVPAGKRVVATVLLAAFPLTSTSQIVADPNAGANRPGVIQTANGLPQVNITRPSGAGVSTNAYTQFDVPRGGAILNNSAGIVATQQAGYINGNPNLGPGQSARIIVNQVTSTLPSQLRGHLEVAGSRAEVVVANPNGLLVDGAGFINTSRVTLTTGLPVFGGNGSLEAFRVTGGRISVEGEGLNGAGVDQVDLIARAVSANAALHANRLNVVAGANHVDRNSLAVTPIAGDGPAPTEGIDVGQLGGMYANKILLVANEAGVGVSSRGVLAAQAGDLTLTSQGRLVLAGQTNAAGQLNVSARDGIQSTGTTWGAQSVTISAGGALANSGTLAAQQNLRVDATAVDSSGTLGAGVASNGAVSQAGDLAISAAGALNATGTTVAGGNATLQGASIRLAGSQTATLGGLHIAATSGGLDTGGAQVSAGTYLTAQAAGTLRNDGGRLFAQGPVRLQAGAVSNRGGQIVTASTTDVRSGAALDNSGGILQAAGAMSIAAGSIDNTAGRITSLNADGLTLAASGALVNAEGTTASGAQGGVIGTNGALTVDAGSIVNHAQIDVAGNATLRAQQVDNRAGNIIAGGTLAAAVENQFDNRQGNLAAQSVALGAGSIDNATGRIEGETLAVAARADLNNRGGVVSQFGAADTLVAAGGKLDNAAGTIASNGGNLDLVAGTIVNDGGTVTHAGTGALAMQAGGSLGNVAGSIQSNGAVTGLAGSMNNAQGRISALGNVGLAVSGAIDNHAGAIQAGNAAQVHAGGNISNVAGRIEAAGANATLLVTGGNIDNTGGRLVNAGDGLTAVLARQALVNANPAAVAGGGVIGGNGDLTLSAMALRNAGTLTAGRNASVDALHLDNSGGALLANGDLAVTTTEGIANHGGRVSAAGLAIDAGAVDNDGGIIEASMLALTSAGALSNAGGQLTQYGQGATRIDVDGQFNNASGTLASNGKSMSITAASFANGGGRISHAGADGLTVTAQTALDNAGGTVQTNGALNLQAQNIGNAAGTLSSQGRLDATATAQINNRQGTVYGADGLSLNAGGTLDNTAGSAQTAGDLTVIAGGALVNQGGTLTANGTTSAASVQAASIANNGGRLTNAGAGSTTIAATGAIDNVAGTLGGNGDVRIAAADLYNTAGGKVAAAANLALEVTRSVANSGGSVYGGTGLTLDQGGATLSNQGGSLLGGRNIKVNVASMSNLGGAVRANEDVDVAGAVSGSGEITAGGDLRLNVNGDYVNDTANRLRADGGLALTATGTLTNTGTLAAGASLTVQGANIANASGAAMTSAATTLNTGGAISNAGRIEGNIVNLTGGRIDNTATVIGNNVRLNAGDISNVGPGAIVAAAQDLKLYAWNSVSNVDGATIYSMGNLEIARDGARDGGGMLANQMNLLTNRSATIEADGNIDIAARTVSNTRTSVVTETGVPESTVQTLKAWFAGIPANQRRTHTSITFPTWQWSNGAVTASADMMNALRAPVTIEVDKATVTNLDTAAKSLSLTTPVMERYISNDPLICNDNDCYGGPQELSRVVTTNPTQYYESIEDTGTSYRITLWPDFDPAVHIRPDQVRVRYDLGVDYHDYNEIERTVTTTVATDRLIGATDPAKIQARGSIRINSDGGTVLNQSSIMAAGGDLQRRANGGTVQDVGTVLQQHVSVTETSTFYWHQKSGGNSDQQVVPYPTTPLPGTTVAALPAIATANGAVQTTAQNITVGSVNAVGQTVGGGGVAGGGASGAQIGAVAGASTGAGALTASGAGGVGPVSGSTSRPQTLGTAAGGIPNLTLPTNGLYTYRTSPGSTYIVATDPRFTQYNNFISSDYMLGALNLDPQKVQKRLGDGFYEEKLVRDQVTALTGRTFLAGYDNQMEEYKALMNNGVAYAQAFDLTPGIGLTDAQMSQLTTDMVWLVSQEVTLPDGTRETVLVPKLYLAQANTVDLNSTGALVVGKSVSLVATGDVDNSGRIVGDMATEIIGNNIVNRGAIGDATQGGMTSVVAVEDVRNLGGAIAGGDVLVAAGRDVINQTQTLTSVNTVGPNGYSASATGIGAVASITASGSAAVLAGRDIDLVGARIEAGDGAMLAAGRDLNIGAVALGTTQDASSRGGQSYSHDKTVTNYGSSIQAGDLVAVAGRDATLSASSISTGGDASLVAGGNLTVVAGTDSHSHSEGSLGGKNAQYTQSSHDDTVKAASVSAGGDVMLGAGQSTAAAVVLLANGIMPTTDPSTAPTGDLALVGADISAGKGANGGGVTMVASGDVVIAEAREVHDADSDVRSRKSGFLSRSSSHDQTSSHADIGVGSIVDGDTVRVVAGKDLTIRDSAIAAADAVDLAARGNVTITAGQNVREESYLHERASSGLSGIGGAGGIGISVGSSQAKGQGHTVAVTQSDARSVVGASNGNVTITAGKNATIIGSDLIAGRQGDDTSAGNIDIQAQNIAIKAAVDYVREESSQSSKSSGVSMAIVGTPLDTARNLAEAQKSDSTVTRVKQTFQELGAAASTMPGVALTVGSNKSSSEFESEAVSHSGSSLSGAGDIRLRATGNGQRDDSGKLIDGDILLAGSSISAGGKAVLDAQRNVDIEASTDTYRESTASSSSGWKLSTAGPSPGDIGRSVGGGPNSSGVSVMPYGSQKANASGDLAISEQNASVVTGNAVTVVSREGDVTVAGSGIAAEKDIVLSALQGKIDILSGEESRTERRDSSGRQIGDLGGNGYAGTVGIRSESHHLDSAQTAGNTVRSQIVSTDGNVTISAKDDLTARGADIAAGQDVTLVGKNVVLDPGEDTSTVNQRDKSSQYGVTLALSGYSVQAAQAAENAARAVEEGKDSRVALLYGVQAALAVANALPGKTPPVAVNKSGNPQNSNGGATIIKATVSVGGGSQESESHSNSNTYQGTTVQAGNNVTIVATGAGGKDAAGYALDGDISARGVDISGKDVALVAARDINLESAQDTTSQSSRSSGGTAGIGVGFGIGGEQNGFTLELAASQNKAKGNGESVTNHNSHVTADNTLTIASGRDTNLRGAQAIGESVIADVGRDLNIESRQDTETYHSQESSSGMQMSLCVPPFCVGTTVSASASSTKGNTDSTYKSVVEQSGLYAGSGGVDVNVKGNTDLKGAVIASTAEAEKNRVVTGTLTTSDLENVAEYNSSTSTIAGSFSGGKTGKEEPKAGGADPNAATNKPNEGNTVSWGGTSLLKNGANSLMTTAAGHAQPDSEGSASGVTKSAIANGTVVITDAEGQVGRTGKTVEETLASLNRDTEGANGSIDRIFDAEKVREEQALGKLQAQTVQQAAPLIYDRVGKLLEGEREDVKVAVHALIGGVMAKALGGEFGTGAAGAAAGTAAIALLNENLGSLGLSEADRNGLLQAVGTIVAGAVAGGGAEGNAAAATAGMADAYNRQLHPEERKWAKANAKSFAQFYEEQTGRALTNEQAENMLLANGYRIVDAVASKGPGGDKYAVAYISAKAGALFHAPWAEYNDASLNGTAGLTPEQAAMPASRPNPQLGIALGGGLGIFALSAVTPVFATAWAAGAAADYAGDAIGYSFGLTTDRPSAGKSLGAGAAAALFTPLALPLSHFGTSTTARIFAGAYNAGLSGTAAGLTTAVFSPGQNPQLAGTLSGTFYAGGQLAVHFLPGTPGVILNQTMQTVPGPLGAAIEKAITTK